MKTIKQILMIATLGTMTGCGASPADETPSAKLEVGTTSEALTIVECQKQATACVQTAKSFTDLAGCSQKFQTCATDSVKQTTAPLQTCQQKADACLKGALTITAIRECRGLLLTCTEAAANTVDNALGDAVKNAQQLIDEATTVALGVLGDATGLAGDALSAVDACQSKATTCLKDVVKLNDIQSCQDTFETCVSGAVQTIDKATALIPIPLLSEVQTAFAGCQNKSVLCLTSAFTPGAVAACQGALQTCVANTTAVADSTVSDINKLLPAAIQLPEPTEAVDCTKAAAQCLLKPFANPLACAVDATSCLTN